MALGRRKKQSQSMWVATADLPRSQGHPFYRALNRLLDEASFDRQVEEMCASFYADGRGRPSIPPGVYFRMLFVGYFEGIDSQRGIAWRCNDSLSLREFIGIGATGRSPDHSSLTVIRKRLPLEVHETVFALVLTIAKEKRLLQGTTVAVDATLLEANAAMKSIVRKDSGDDWKAYLKKLATEAGIEDPSDEDLRKFDKQRTGKKVSNAEWESKTDPDSRITKMKDGRTHLAYKAEHAVELESELIVATTVALGDVSDPQSMMTTLSEAEALRIAIGSEARIEELVADKGYHDGPLLGACAAEGIRTYIPEPKSPHGRKWTNKTKEERRAVLNNRRRLAKPKSKRLQKLRSERAERSFAHVCETGGARRSWLRGLENVAKRYLVHVAGRNLGRILFLLLGIGTPRGLQWPRSRFASLAEHVRVELERLRLRFRLVIDRWCMRMRISFASRPTTVAA